MMKEDAIRLLRRLQEPEAWEPKITDAAYTALQMAIDALNDIPSVEPERGEWEEKEIFHNGDEEPIIEEWQSARCSVCGKYHTTPFMYYFDNFNFCPNCGVDMRESEGK